MQTVYKKSRAVTKAALDKVKEQERKAEIVRLALLRDQELREQEHQSSRAKHLYDRAGRLPLVFAEDILTHHKRIDSVGGAKYIDGRLATFYTQIVEANRILKSLGHPQIEDAREWLV